MPQPFAPISTRLPHPVREWPGGLGRAQEVDVDELERFASIAGGAGLAVYGLSRGTLGGLGLALLGGALIYRGATGHCAGYEALGIRTAEPRGPRSSVAAQHGARVEEAVVVLRPREELYRFWRDLSNLPRIMPHLESVQVLDGRRSHWVAKGPLSTLVEWDAEIITERENELIGWRSVGDSVVDTAGSVHFTTSPGGGTEVRVNLKYDPPGGKLGIAASKLLGQSPSEQIRQDLITFKHAMEADSTTSTNEGGATGRDS